jgi:hypothetical protein
MGYSKGRHDAIYSLSGCYGAALTQLQSSGTSFAIPCKGEAELRRTLHDLGVSDAFDSAGVSELYDALGFIVGKWVSEKLQMKVSPVAKALGTTAENLEHAARLLSGCEPGIRSSLQTAATLEAIKYLALDPSVGSEKKAQEILSTFLRDASRVAHVCKIASASLTDGSDAGGRPALRWYDDFTALLIRIAQKAGVTPTQQKDRIDEVRSGWLFDAAQAFESFLYPEMRSPTAEACGKRLERSQKALRCRSSV